MGTEVELKPEHWEFVKSVAKEQGFGKFDIELSNGSGKGENYLSQIVLATLKDKSKNKSLDLVIKLASDNEKLRKHIEFITDAFYREAYIYETVLPAFMEYQNEHGIKNGFERTAKEYGSNLTYPKEVVVLENLKTSDYKLWNRRIPMNEDHIQLVLTNYAKLHAISFAMSQLDPDRFNQLTENMGNVWLPDTKEKYEVAFNDTKDIFVKTEVRLKGLDQQLAAFKKFVSNLEDYVVNEFATSSEDDLVISHGDCWCNNMLFKYEDSENPNKPTKVCLIDWQLSRKCSPAFDLAYFLCCSVSGKALSKNIDTYLKFYHDHLSEYVRAFGGDLESVFPYSLLEKHFKKYSKFGFYMSIMIMKILLHEDGEAFDLEDLHGSEDRKAVDHILEKEMKNDQLYTERIRDIVSFMTEREYI